MAAMGSETMKKNPLQPPSVSLDVMKELCKKMPGLAERVAGKVNAYKAMKSPEFSKAPPPMAPNTSISSLAGAPLPMPPSTSISSLAGAPLPMPPSTSISSLAGPEQIAPEVLVREIQLPGVKSLCNKFSIDGLLESQLDQELRKRPKTFEGDLETIEEALTSAKSPAAALMVKIKELQQGSFVGMLPNQKQIEELALKFSLDEQAVHKLTDCLIKLGKEKAKVALEQLNMHLERSNKPSALVMMSLAKLRNGENLGEPTRAVATGSLLWEQREKEKKEQEAKQRHERDERHGRDVVSGRSRSPGCRKHRSRDTSRERRTSCAADYPNGRDVARGRAATSRGERDSLGHSHHSRHENRGDSPGHSHHGRHGNRGDSPGYSHHGRHVNRGDTPGYSHHGRHRNRGDSPGYNRHGRHGNRGHGNHDMSRDRDDRSLDTARSRGRDPAMVGGMDHGRHKRRSCEGSDGGGREQHRLERRDNYKNDDRYSHKHVPQVERDRASHGRSSSRGDHKSSSKAVHSRTVQNERAQRSRSAFPRGGRKPNVR